MHAGDRPKNAAEWMRSVEQHVQGLDQRVRNAGSGAAAGNMVTTTDANGQASFLFGRVYATAPVVVPVGGNDELVSVVAVSTSGFTARFRSPTSAEGTLLANALVRCLWHAIPATT